MGLQELQLELADLRVRNQSLQRANDNFRSSGAAGELSEELADAQAELAALRDEMAER
jgi:predicted  nucleic acid-binding Zn-ribbon protein